MVRGEPEGGDGADVHPVVADLGLAGFQSLGGPEDDGDLGPSLRILFTATQAPATAATSGKIHTNESRVRFLVTVFASGAWGIVFSLSGISDLSSRIHAEENHR